MPLCVKTGHGYIKDKMKETNAILGGEMSGHTFFKDRYYGFDDAIYAGCRIIEIIAKNYKLGEKLKDIIEKKLEKFARYFEDDATAKVILREINQDKDAMEITVNFGGGKIMRAEVVSDNMYDNIDLVLPKLERQVRKYRTKLGKKVKESAFDMDALYSYSEAPIEELAVGRVKKD